MFRLLFERSADPIWLFDPRAGVFVDCNQAAVELMQAGSKERLLRAKPEDVSAPLQPDGRPSSEAAAEITALIERTGGHRFEWLVRRFDGRDVPVEVVATAIVSAGQPLHVVVSRDISERKEAEEEIRRLNATLERRIAERTAELSASEERLRTLVEHAPEAIVVFDGGTGRFVSGNENAARLYGLSRERLEALHPADVSPEFQPDGRRSSEAAQELIGRAVAGEAPVFEWMHRHVSGRLIPCEVRLVRLPGKGRTLIRGSVIDNTDRRRREQIQQATFEISEAVHTADDLEHLYERIHNIVKGLMPAGNFYIALLNPVHELITFPYYVDEFSNRPAPRKLTHGLTGEVIRLGKPLLVNESMSARKKQIGEAVIIEGVADIPYVESGRPAATWLGVPLRFKDGPVGVMAVQDYHNENAYGEEEKQLLTFVAEQIALAIERKRAEQQLRERSDRVLRHRNVLVELAKLDKSDLDFALEKICALAASTLGAARVGYWSLQAGDTAIRCERLHAPALPKGGAEDIGITLCQSEAPAYFSAMGTKQPILANDAEKHPATRELAGNYLRPLGITSMLDAPVWLDGRVVGVLCHEHVGAPREWLPEEVDFAASLATMVSLALEGAQRAKSEQALRESEQKFRALFETSSQGVMIHDEEKFIEVNPAAVRIMGYDRPEQLIGKHPVDTSPPIQPNGETSAALAGKYIQACMESGSVRFDWMGRTAKGSDIPLEVILSRVEMGGRQFIQAVIDDITERKKAEAELLRSLAREKELSALKSNFVSMVSHEFRTPLGIIMSSAEILRDYLESLEPEERKHHLDSITSNTRRMSELMEEVLVLGRLDAGKMDFRPAPIDFRKLCGRLVEETGSATDRQCPIGLTYLAEGEAKADERLCSHIFTNLLTNAVKYSQRGSAVEFLVKREGADAVFEVRDRGIGIAEADKAWLFQAFCRGRNVGSRPGTGLGLVIVKRCVELHKGSIRIDSTAGEGTVVTVRLPVFPGEIEGSRS